MTRMRASTAMTPSARTMTGLRSSSATWGRSSASRETRSRRVAQRLDVGAPVPSRTGAARMERIRSSASVSVSGASRAAWSVEHVGGDAAEPEHHHRAEHRFLHHADHGLDAAGDHGLDQHPGHPPGEAGLQAAHRGAYLIGAVQVQLDGACRGLVQQAGHVSLERHVTAQSAPRPRPRASASATRRNSTMGRP